MATFSPFTINYTEEIDDDIIQKNDIEYSSADKDLSEILVEEEIVIEDEVSIFIPSFFEIISFILIPNKKIRQ